MRTAVLVKTRKAFSADVTRGPDAKIGMGSMSVRRQTDFRLTLIRACGTGCQAG